MTRPVRSLKGIAAAPGLASGPAAIWTEQTLSIPRRTGADRATEGRRLDEARQAVGQEIKALRQKVTSEASEAEAAIFDAHAMFLTDTALLKKVTAGLEGGLNAEAAWMDAIEHFASQLAALPDPTLSARAADVRDVGQRVLRSLLGRSAEAGLTLEKPSVVVARDLAPSQTVSLDKRLVLAFCTAEGGPTSHTAILSRALGLPAVVGLGHELLQIRREAVLLVDGDRGEVVLEPDEDSLLAFEERGRHARRKAEAEQAQAGEPAITRDHHRVEIVANVGSPSDARSALTCGAEGIGLLRTEFLYLDRQVAPTETEQTSAYDAILDIMGTRPVVVRTLDVGGDKSLPYLDLGHEANPFLGWRAIRMCLDRPDFFKTQLRALLRSGVGHDLRIMFPMVSTIEEVRKAKVLLAEAQDEAQAAGHSVAERIQVGIMVEIPSVAVLADRFSDEVDFFSIGTNDLTQYTMAAERTNNRVAHLGDALHPAVLRLIQRVINAGHEAGIWVGVCGELAGDPEGAPVLLGLGLDEFSMAPPLIPRAKAVLRRWTLTEARQLAEEALKLDTASGVRELVQARQPS
jgi:phosphoenolpyruvate-protein phosphotransferase